MNFATARTSVLALTTLAMASCASTEDLRILVDLQSPEVFRHAASVEFSIHPATDAVAAERCLGLREALATNPPVFEVVPLRDSISVAPCDLFDGSAVFPDLPRDAVAYLVAVRDGENRTIASGCEVRGLDDFGEDDTMTRVLTVVTLSTPFFANEVAGTDPPFPAAETRCGSESPP